MQRFTSLGLVSDCVFLHMVLFLLLAHWQCPGSVLLQHLRHIFCISLRLTWLIRASDDSGSTWSKEYLGSAQRSRSSVLPMTVVSNPQPLCPPQEAACPCHPGIRFQTHPSHNNVAIPLCPFATCFGLRHRCVAKETSTHQ